MNPLGLLSLAEQLPILRGLLPIFEYAQASASQMGALGFRKFLPISGVAHAGEYSREDLELSELISIEQAKEQFAWPIRSWPNSRQPEMKNAAYHSPILQSLRAKRATYVENVFGATSPEQIPAWQFEIDPILRQNTKMAMLGRRVEEERRRARDAVLQNHRQFEIERLSSSLADEFADDAAGCRELFHELMLREAPSLGFSVDRERDAGSIYFSKTLTSRWDISLILSHLDWWGKGDLDIVCAIIPNSCKGRPRTKESGDFLFVDYPRMLPYFIFYRTFGSLHELEVNIKAHLALYGILKLSLEPLLIDQLPY